MKWLESIGYTIMSMVVVWWLYKCIIYWWSKFD